VRAIPGAGRTAVGGERAGALIVRVGESPERGRANRAIERALAEALALPRGALALAAGERSREKCFRVEGIERAELERRLGPLLRP
jgi:uncharacterized protein YggU (UPF0235/DUF167 family)